MTTPEDTAATITVLDLEPEWLCCGCGKPAPDREKQCKCPTACVARGKFGGIDLCRHRAPELYDERCADLARHFLPEGRPAQLRDLARAFQLAADEWFKDEEQ